MNILVTGGTGYIGSHTCVALLEAGYSVTIVDNLSNSRKEVVEKIKKISNKEVQFYKIDLTDRSALENLFQTIKFDSVIHFAGLKSIKESVNNSSKYYYNNLVSTLNLVESCKNHDVNNLVFSSSATVYGDNEVPFIETMELKPSTNPYGETKVMCERILQDIANVNSNFSLAILRYFNPIGAHPSGLLGEKPTGVPNNIMPYITKIAKGELDILEVFGDDYPTLDGTGVRDYVHVMDIAEGHLAALNNLHKGTKIYNLGTGKGTSVLELIEAFEQANNIKIPYKVVERRLGDIAISYASTTKAKEELGWVAKRDILDMTKDAWNYEINN